MPTLAVDNFNIVCATLGAFIAMFGLVSFLFKEKFYLSETLISLVAGVIFSPRCANLIRPLQYALGNEDTLGYITMYFSRLVLGIQLVIAGVQLPSKYLRQEWKSLAYLLGPGMVGMWVCASLLIWALVPDLQFVYALVVGACITPTDPVLANNIVKGKFADKNIPGELQNIIIAESGANDGLGYPFLFLPLLLIKYVVEDGTGSSGSIGTAMSTWVVDIWIYQILLGTVYGATVGYIAKELLHWAEKRKYVDRESFLVFAVALALFITGTAGMIGSDDVLACFIAGNSFTWDDWFRQETQDDSLQPTVDMLLNVSIFLWFGAVCPWHMFVDNTVIPIYRLVFLGILILLFRRLPVIFAMHKQIRQIADWRQALFVGYFGPIGVSGVFYLYVALDWLAENVTSQGAEREDAIRLSEILTVIVWFMVICSVIGHGLSIPLGKLGLYLPRTLSRAISMEASRANSRDILPRISRQTSDVPMHEESGSEIPTFPVPLWRAGRQLVGSWKDAAGSWGNSTLGSSKATRGHTPGNVSPGGSVSTAPVSRIFAAETIQLDNTCSKDHPTGIADPEKAVIRSASPATSYPLTRSIRFPDEPVQLSSILDSAKYAESSPPSADHQLQHNPPTGSDGKSATRSVMNEALD